MGQLGRWVVSGNSGMHTLTIYDVAAASVIATVVINTSGATPGQYLYGSITPITLVAATPIRSRAQKPTAATSGMTSTRA